jgi:hypothetical protein
MGRKLVVLVLSLLAFGLVSVAPARADDAILRATLTGANERPGPGDPDAFGSATIYIDDDTNRLCLFMSFSNVDGTLSGLHIHLAPTTSPGPIVIPFTTPTSSPFFQCLGVANEALLDNIAANPQQYYINLHSTPLFGPGAIRGQLTRA